MIVMKAEMEEMLKSMEKGTETSSLVRRSMREHHLPCLFLN